MMQTAGLVGQAAQDNRGIQVAQAAIPVVEVVQAAILVVALAVEGLHPAKVHLGLILCSQLGLHQATKIFGTVTTEEKRESFCADFHFTSNDMVQFFLSTLDRTAYVFVRRFATFNCQLYGCNFSERRIHDNKHTYTACKRLLKSLNKTIISNTFFSKHNFAFFLLLA